MMFIFSPWKLWSEIKKKKKKSPQMGSSGSLTSHCCWFRELKKKKNYGKICHNLKVTILAVLRVQCSGVKYIHIVMTPSPPSTEPFPSYKTETLY